MERLNLDKSVCVCNPLPMEPKTKETPRCPKCASTQILYRIRLKSFICRHCGHEWEKITDALKTKEKGATAD